MTSFNDIIATQKQISQGIENLFTNFKKDSSSRKTADYIKRRIELLDSYWQDYEDSFIKLSARELDQAPRDYINRDRETVKERYENIRAHILNYEPPAERSITDPKTPTFVQKAEQSEQIKSTAGIKSSSTTSKTEEMLRKQQSNFKAFQRTIAYIDLEGVSERWELDDILSNLKSRWDPIDSLHWELDSELNSSNEEYENAFFDYEKKYQALKKAINRKIWSVSHIGQTTPKIDIPTFHGNYNNWVSFKDLFQETIHNNPSLSNATKMQYLKSKVKGEAEKLIQHLPISADNYNTCWEILNQRYHNKKLIFTSHMNSIMNLPVMQQKSVSHLKRLHDTTYECLNAIKNLGVDIKSWDPILVYILTQKLDTESYTDYVESVGEPRELPVLKEFLNFLELKFTTLDTSRRKQDNSTQKYQGQAKQQHNNNHNQKYNYYKNSISTSNKNVLATQLPSNKKGASAKYHCSLCNSSEHGIYFCKKFIDMSPYNRFKTVRKLNLCPNCLHDHQGKPCYSDRVCRDCNQDHNSLLHEAYAAHASRSTTADNASAAAAGASARFSNTTDANSNQGKQVRSSSHVSKQDEPYEVLLPTAIIAIQSLDGSYYKMRALLDQGSQISLITEKAAQFLRLPRKKCKGIISGIGDKESSCKGMLTIKCLSTVSAFTFETDVLIMNQLIKNLPNQTISKPNWEYLDHIKLADPEFNVSRPVDVLLGADIYSEILMNGLCRADSNLPAAQQTQLGWILSGNARTLQCNVLLTSMEGLQQFWEIEEISEPSDLSLEDKQCIEYYQETTIRRPDGRYEVRMPLKPDYKEKLGQSKLSAIAQFYKLEQRLAKNQVIASSYKLFIDEYLSLGHMTPSVDNNTSNTQIKCYLPHHCVTREDSTTTKLRVVFNASQKTSTGMSLNDVMCRGPNLQQDIQSLLIKWRLYKYAFTADIEKMFRQIWVNQEDQYLQMIIWRDNQKKQIQEYQLATVTYGTKAAPFLAMMTLKQLAHDEKDNYQNSQTARVLDESFYMDDLIHGSHSINAAKELQADMINLLKSGGFNLRKWKSNSAELLQDVELDLKNQETFDFKQSEPTKTLGLGWNPYKDTFTFKLKVESSSLRPTKRILLSEISKFFDPLGWLAPLTTKLKILFQDVWKAKIQWDEPAPQDICDKWIKIKTDINIVSQYHVPRWLKTEENSQIEIHGFCDASTKAYAAVIYCKINKKDSTSVIIVASKTKVVPLNKNSSLPRLELCGAVLLSKLMAKIKKCLSNHHTQVYGWCDSMAVLGWLNGDAKRWKPFVANRVKLVTDIMTATCWRYVKSKDNPADCASRGLTATQLKEHSLWWQGPTWLATFEPEKAPQQNYVTNEEIKKAKQVNVVQLSSENETVKTLLERYSSLDKAVRVLAWALRFTSKKNNHTIFLTIPELKKARFIIIKSVQEVEFNEEISCLSEGKHVNSKSKIYSLNPILDDNGILRVGGRLKHSNLSPEMKHPIILSSNTRLADLIIDQAHKSSHHGGARITTSFIRQKFWILGGNNATKKRLRLCVKCRRHEPLIRPQQMGDLPSARINPSRPFLHCGVDYTGHVSIKANKGRGIKTTKGYVAVFVCMATKAVHLELVSDLSTSAFIAALKRMIARRGLPTHVYSDNGSNFIGANKVLKQELADLQGIFNQEFMSEISSMGIEWHFNAPSWPSAGGLWEAAVKSLKHHLKRVIGEQHLTYEEFSTLLSQIEGCLNSRPLCTLTEDPDDLNFLTPSHFLASGPILTLYETESDLRTRWHLTQRIFKDIWSRWRDEYLTQLSARSKWRQPQNNIMKDDIVIIKDENLPPGKWALGRVVELHPGSDGLVRVVTLKTKTGVMKRPVIKLCVLPVNQSKNYQDSKKNENQVLKVTTSSKKWNSFALSTLFSMLFLFILVPPINCTYNMTSLQNNNSLYFDRISNMHLIRDDWRLVVYYNTNPYQESNVALNKYIKYLDNLCLQINAESHCEGIMFQLHHEVAELKYYNDILMNHNCDASRQRRRRGLINGVGYVANSLFGVLDSRFAEKYENDIHLIRQNQNHLASLWKNQTSVVEAEFNMLKRTESMIDKQHKLINKKFYAVEKAVNQVQNEIRNASLINDFITTAMIANNILFSLKNIQETLLDTVTNIYNGKFNFHLLTPDQLRRELGIISEQLPKDLALPIRKTDSLSEIYNLLQVRARVTAKFIIFEIKIPLVGEDTYEISKMIPIPRMADQNTDIVVIPISDYIAVNLRQDAFVKMTEQDLKTCIPRNPETLLCLIKTPITIIKDDYSFCEVRPNSRSCETISRPCTNKLVELNKFNTYLYFCCGKCQLKLVCEDQITSVQMSHAGFFNTDQSCIIKSANFFIYSHRLGTSHLSLSADIKIPEISQMNHIVNISLIENVTINLDQENTKEQINNIEKKLEIMKENQPLMDGVISNDIHHFAAIYILYALIALVAIVWAWSRYKCRFSPAAAVEETSAAPPVAQPRPRPPTSTSVQCSDHYSEVNEFTRKSAPNQSVKNKNLSSTVKDARVSIKDTGSSPVVNRPSFKLVTNQDYS